MRAINLRLTDAEHAELFEAAHENRRSMQREIIARLFDGALAGADDGGLSVAEPAARAVQVRPDQPTGSNPAGSVSAPASAREFKGPDPKGKRR